MPMAMSTSVSERPEREQGAGSREQGVRNPGPQFAISGTTGTVVVHFAFCNLFVLNIGTTFRSPVAPGVSSFKRAGVVLDPGSIRDRRSRLYVLPSAQLAHFRSELAGGENLYVAQRLARLRERIWSVQILIDNDRWIDKAVFNSYNATRL